MRRLNLDQLRAVTEVMRLGSFSAAARSLNLTQPAISFQVRELEERLGLELIERLGKRAYPTPAGAELIEYAHRIDRDVDDAMDAMRRRREGGLARVRIGTGSILLASLLPSVLREVQRKRPQIELVVTTGTSDEISAHVAQNSVDIGLVSLPIAERSLTVMRVREDPMLAVLPPSERRAPPVLDPATLARYPLIFDVGGTRIHQLARDWFRAAGIEPRATMEIGHFAIRNIVSAGLGASILTIESVLADASAPVILRALDPQLTRELAIVRRSDKPDDPALMHVQDALLALRNRNLMPPGIRVGPRRGSGGRGRGGPGGDGK
ncbi:MAG TPA: LysR substrate-binding domain-containing protein [Burkholderiales bacterium]|nr:LysR substrate-binding domain-containing protein [Burkholderiales bacterium]